MVLWFGGPEMTLPMSLAHSGLQFPPLQTGEKNPASKGWICLQRQPHSPHSPPTAPPEGTLTPLETSLAADVRRRQKNVQKSALLCEPQSSKENQTTRRGGGGVLQGLLPRAPGRTEL